MPKLAKPTLSERRSQELRTTIALTARDLFMTDGDTSATVERICEIVGIAPRTFHRHFQVKEDVVIPLFRRFGGTMTGVLATAPAGADPLETLVHAFTTRVDRRDLPELDREFMTLIVRNAQYRLRWLECAEQLYAPVTEFLTAHYELDEDPFLRSLPAHLIAHTSRHAYIQWVDTGDFAELEVNHRRGFSMVLHSLRPSSR
ncbi:MAG: putative transcriptional regulator, TetR family [Nocardia sp.]|uniref:TetR/AcrR family transcriptional regulator n=1 Tax=Nocardia sp. TaxID=1821 RepID=UPI002611A80A|nr:TetR/AcrR family transcriptional regulator [Nocardia sp.]MCU1644983.1 putative transcriptional regulator, TetR family [Nocardia sp.]